MTMLLVSLLYWIHCRIAQASKTIFFTQKNDDVGAVSVRKRSCTAKILKVVSFLAERFLGHSSLLVV